MQCQTDQIQPLSDQNAEGAPEGGFDHLGAVFGQFAIVFAYFWGVFWLAGVFLIKSRFGLFDCFWAPPKLVWHEHHKSRASERPGLDKTRARQDQG